MVGFDARQFLYSHPFVVAELVNTVFPVKELRDPEYNCRFVFLVLGDKRKSPLVLESQQHLAQSSG